jgi:hypothetical protein
MAQTIYWAELQGELSAAGLSISLGLPNQECAPMWGGQLDGQPFAMSIPPKNEKDGFRDWMVLSLYGQNTEKVIPVFSKFMGYQPFASYKFLSNPKCTAAYEWRRGDLEKTLAEIQGDANITDFIQLDEGFKSPAPPGPETFYQQFTEEIVAAWEEALKENPQADFNGLWISRLLPFLKKALPRIGKGQSLFGLSLICLDRKLANETSVVRYGLEPLLSAGILTAEEVEEIVDWYKANNPEWDSGSTVGRFEKEFVVDGQRYRLYTDSYRNCRDLNLQTVS